MHTKPYMVPWFPTWCPSRDPTSEAEAISETQSRSGSDSASESMICQSSSSSCFLLGMLVSRFSFLTCPDATSLGPSAAGRNFLLVGRARFGLCSRISCKVCAASCQIRCMATGHHACNMQYAVATLCNSRLCMNQLPPWLSSSKDFCANRCGHKKATRTEDQFPQLAKPINSHNYILHGNTYRHVTSLAHFFLSR